MTDEEVLEEYKAIPHEVLVAAVVQMKAEVINAYKALNILTEELRDVQAAVLILIQLQEAQAGVTQGEGPGQYL